MPDSQHKKEASEPLSGESFGKFAMKVTEGLKKNFCWFQSSLDQKFMKWSELAESWATNPLLKNFLY